MMINLYVAWVGFFLGGIAGAAAGVFFHDPDWQDGYTSWRRRVMRLGHVSFFGIGFLNLAFALTVGALDLQEGLGLPSALLLVGAAAMPTLCYLSAWKPVFRHLFFVPVLAIISATGIVAWKLVSS
jgi:hypothetical protein